MKKNERMFLGIASITLLFFVFSKKKERVRKLNRNYEIMIKEYLRKNYNEDFSGVVQFGIRGGLFKKNGDLEQNDNVVDAWNDTIGFFDSKNKKSFAIAATVDAGLYYQENPMMSQGTFRLVPGHYRYTFGKHFGRDAFRMIDIPARGYRSNTKNKYFVPGQELYVENYPGEFGINLHAKYTSNSVGRSSAGCQVPDADWKSKDWNYFYNYMKDSGQKSFEYYLIEAKDLLKGAVTV